MRNQDSGKEIVGVEVTPELIQELLKNGLAEVETENAHVNLMYETVPRNQTEGWNE